MDWNAILDAIGNVGFPIVMTGVLCYYIANVQDKTNDAIDKMNQTLTLINEFLKEQGMQE